MRVLVTGAFGNLGTSALGALVERGHTVRALTPRPAQRRRLARRLGVDLVAGDVRDPAEMRTALAGADVVIHLAAVIPPESDEQPERARAVNVDGTRHVIEAALSVTPRPRLLFASSFDVFGRTQHLPPPRRVGDPVAATDVYSEHKIEGERMVRESGLDAAIFRFSDVPKMALRPAHSLMFEIPLANRIEALHTRDAGRAIANALPCDAVWGRTWLIGGGPRCQVTFGEYLGRMLRAMGLPALPAEAFSTTPYPTDWIDSQESERLLAYQRHSFDDIVREIAALLGWRRLLLPALGPLLRRRMLGLSRHWREAERTRRAY